MQLTSLRVQQWLVWALAFAAAFWLETFVHELGHAVAGKFYGMGPVLHSNFVHYETEAQGLPRVVGKLAGATFSVALGGLALVWLRSTRSAAWGVRLWALWLSYHGWMAATGYLFTTAFAPGGDFTDAATELGVPAWGRVVMTVLGFYAIKAAAGLLTPEFERLLSAGNEATTRVRAIVTQVLPAALLGTLLALPSALPVPHWLSLMHNLTLWLGCVWLTEYVKKQPAPVAPVARPPSIGRLLALNAMVFVAVLLVERVVLRPGIAL